MFASVRDRYHSLWGFLTMAPHALLSSYSTATTVHEYLVTSFRGLGVDGTAAEIDGRASEAEVFNLGFDVCQARNGLLCAKKKRTRKTS